MNKDDLIKRTRYFAHRCVKIDGKFAKNISGKSLKGQLIRCSTSVAANYRAACLGISKAAFASKLSIVIEEADESEFWLESIIDEQLKPKHLVESLKDEAHELTSIFIASRKTIKRKT